MEKMEVYILGGSGHAMSVLDALLSNKFVVNGYFDLHQNERFNLPYLGKESTEKIQEVLNDKNAVLFPGVGNAQLRKAWFDHFINHQARVFNCVHATASVSQLAALNSAIFVGANAVVNAHAKVETGCIVNTGAIVEHECVIGEYSHLAPGCVLAGNVSIGENSFIGANATVKQGVCIGSNVIVGAGSVVIQDIPDNTVYVGNPARFLRNND